MMLSFSSASEWTCPCGKLIPYQIFLTLHFIYSLSQDTDNFVVQPSTQVKDCCSVQPLSVSHIIIVSRKCPHLIDVQEENKFIHSLTPPGGFPYHC